MSKRAYSDPAEACVRDEGVWHDNTPIPSGVVRIRIGGLMPVGDDIFELAGVQVREIDWPAVAKALGRGDAPLPDALANEIDGACFRYDVAEILADRIERR